MAPHPRKGFLRQFGLVEERVPAQQQQLLLLPPSYGLHSDDLQSHRNQNLDDGERVVVVEVP